MIQVQSVTHRYGAQDALRDVTIQVPAGALIGLVGPNGAGKTTLIRAIATLLHPTSGTVSVAGHDVVRDAARVREVLGYLPERASPYPDLTAWEHLDLFAGIAGHQGAEKARRIAAALDAAGLADRADSLTAELSQGLRQRLALQATLLHDPRVLVLDEPTDGLDPESREVVLHAVRARADRGTAVLLSSHVLAELEEHADDVLILSAGRVAPSAAPVAASWRIRVRGPVEAALAIVRATGVAAQVVDGAVLLGLPPGTDDPADVVAALVGAGQAVVEVVRVEARLWDRYRAVTHGEAS